MNRLCLFILFFWEAIFVHAIPFGKDKMTRIYNEVKTPFKYGLVLAPDDNYHKMDCPTVFRKDNKWYMTYLVYNGKDGLDGRGYETWIATSEDLLHWETVGRILSYKDSGWDRNQRGGYPSLIDWTWGGSYEIQTYQDRHWMTYIGGEGTGYEGVRAPLHIGLAWTDQDASLTQEWMSKEDGPLMSINDKEAQWWEKLIQYKSNVYWDKAKTLGQPFVMFYNAGGINPDNQLKAERIGIALSKNMRKWKRLKLRKDDQAGNPVFYNEVGGIITGDAQIVRMDDCYVMFYFSAYDPSRKYNAYNTFAVSDDLLNWQRWDGEDLVYPTKDYDEMFAHKSYVVKHDGIVYHFYCAVNNDGQRGIAVATSQPMGKSAVCFPKPEPSGQRKLIDLNENWTTWLWGDTVRSVVTLPHNHDDYHGYRQLKHGNLHGTAMYEKAFRLKKDGQRAYFLQFEGIGTYATVTVNGHEFPREPVGRLVYTLDVTPYLLDGNNTVTIKVEHPEMISDMPWVCGGCSSEWGFSEGSQPFGIFRPVTLEETYPVRIEPFGIHIWNNTACDSIFYETEVRNYTDQPHTVEVVNKFTQASGKTVFRQTEKVTIPPHTMIMVKGAERIETPHLWNLDDPYLYGMTSLVKDETNKTVDNLSTPYGIRSVSWPVKRNDGDQRFLLNGHPVFINGTCEYEHLLGQSHAFTRQQIEARVKMIRQAGFNAFREAHQPHNLLYQQLFDAQGMLFWSQFSAHIWYDTPAFRDNFKRMLVKWIRERRNSPSIVLWGLQNESVLPKDFAEECTAIIRQLDPTANTMRAVTTCNGGEGTDWNVVQNWSGTYGGDATRYDRELKSPAQLLNGEYGAWRTLGLHGDVKNSEDRFCDLLQLKALLAEQAADSVCGHFQWLFVSHENPGRVQPDESVRRIDKIGPLNYKGLLTIWEEPTDAFYMYRANHCDKQKEPMVYYSNSGRVYSNCDSVAVHKQGESVHAVGYVDGKVVAEDAIGEIKPLFVTAADRQVNLLKPNASMTYLYRVNCGGDDYTDSYGNRWMQDQPAFSHSWGETMGMDAATASQSRIEAPIHGAGGNDELFRTFRYGRHLLKYQFPLPNGIYNVELYFAEPWIGRGFNPTTDCERLRMFSVACNGDTVIKDLDLWAECGYAGACKKTVQTTVDNGWLTISFPQVKSGQAVISAIAVSSQSPMEIPVMPSTLPVTFWKDLQTDTLSILPKELLPTDIEAFPAVKYQAKKKNEWILTPGVAKEYALRFRYKNTTGSAVTARMQLIDAKGILLQDRDIAFPPTPAKYKQLSTTTETQINAGKYRLILKGADTLEFDYIEIQ